MSGLEERLDDDEQSASDLGTGQSNDSVKSLGDREDRERGR